MDYIPGDINVFVGMTGVKTGFAKSTTTNTNKTTVNNIATTPGVLKSGMSSSSGVVNKNLFREFFEVQGLVIQSSSNLDVLFSSGNYSTNSTIECISAT